MVPAAAWDNNIVIPYYNATVLHNGMHGQNSTAMHHPTCLGHGERAAVQLPQVPLGVHFAQHAVSRLLSLNQLPCSQRVACLEQIEHSSKLLAVKGV
jgi:hypothetical protein